MKCYQIPQGIRSILIVSYRIAKCIREITRGSVMCRCLTTNDLIYDRMKQFVQYPQRNAAQSQNIFIQVLLMCTITLEIWGQFHKIVCALRQVHTIHPTFEKLLVVQKFGRVDNCVNDSTTLACKRPRRQAMLP